MNAIFMAWIVLGISVMSEVAGTIALRQSAGFTRIGPALLAGLFYIAAVWLMAIALRQLEMGVTYEVWAASGTAITALVGIAVFQEQASLQKLTGIAIILLGVLVLSIERTGDACSVGKSPYAASGYSALKRSRDTLRREMTCFKNAHGFTRHPNARSTRTR